VAVLTPAQELAEARAARAAAERANRAKSRFLAAASHDLRQPLQALRLLNAALQEYLLTDDMALNILHDSERALEVMDRLLGSLLDISKIDSGVIVPELQVFRLSDLFNDLRGKFSRMAEEKGLRLVIMPCRLTVRSDRILLDSILSNLLSNALRYTHTGKILLGCRRLGASVRIEVWDTGTGIPEAEFENIFDEFYQIGSPDRDSNQGLGLGLSIVRAYARLLQHPLGIRSQPGRGSVFSVETPLGNALASAPEEGASGASGGWKPKDCRVLIIEDDPLALKAMAAQLEAWGMKVMGARGGREAVANLMRNIFSPDIIITDYHLQGRETGEMALAQIRPLLRDNVPVIFLTGDSLGEVRGRIGAQYAHLLQKPVAPGKLRVLIRNLMAG
jgi:two-component system, sensor histidine kinase